MNRLTRWTCVVSAISVLAACNRQVDIKIGVVAPMSGALAQYGKDIAHGAEIAMDELNKDIFMIDGKRAHFELVLEDDKASPEEGMAAAKRLVNAKVAAVFGHFNSGVTIAAAPLYASADIPQLSVSTNPKYTRMGLKTAFRITADDIQQGAALGRLMRSKLHAKTVFMIDDRTTFGLGLADEVLKALQQGKVEATRESVDQKAVEYGQLAQKINSAHPDLVFFGGDAAVGIPLLKALRSAGSTAKFVAGDAICDASFIKGAEGAADHDFYCTIAGVPPSWLSAGIGFTQMYKEKYGQPGAYSSLSYDGIHVLAQAMQRGNSIDPKIYLPEMTKESFTGKIQGAIEFDSKGDIKDGTIVIYEAVKGQLTEKRNLL
jgi:branched-chain amino acid transport system substrate-binding protein